MQEPVRPATSAFVTQGEDSGSSVRLYWGPVIAGAIAATAVSFVLLAFGSGIGLSISSYAPTWRGSSASLGILSGFWVLIIAVGSFALGGYMAGRFRTRHTPGAKADEVEFRDGMHGLMVWALAVILSAVIAIMAAWSVAPAGQANGPAAAGATATYPGMSRVLSYDVDRLLRTERRIDTPVPEEARREIGRLLVASLDAGTFSPEDRGYLARLVASQTGLAAAEAERRVDGVISAARRQAARARRGGVVLAFMTAASLLLGALVAWMAAGLGGRHRDEDRSPSLPTPNVNWRNPLAREADPRP